MTTDRPGDWCYVQRSTDGGATWTATHADYFILDRLTQAPSDTSRILINDPLRFSTDAGWSWRAPWGFRTIRTLIPGESEHRFRSKVNSDSGHSER